MNQKGLPLRIFLAEGGQTQILILAGIVILVAVAGGIFYLGRISAPKPQNVATSSPQPSTTLSPTTSPDPTANWKTYTNARHAYTIQYPQEYTVKEDRNSIWIGDQIEIEVLNYLPNYPKYGEGCGETIKKEDSIKIFGMQVRKIDGLDLCIIGGNTLQTYKRYILKKDENYYILTLWELPSTVIGNISPDRDPAEISQDKIQIFNQILSTFRFLP